MMEKRTFQAMGTSVELMIAVENADLEATPAPSTRNRTALARRVLSSAEDRIRELEARLSRFSPQSDIGRLNESVSRWISIHADTAEVLRLAIEAWRNTAGIFDPCLGSTMKTIGYDKSFDRIKPSLIEGDPLPHSSNQEVTTNLYLLPEQPPKSVIRWNRDEHPYLHLRKHWRKHQAMLTERRQVDLGGIAKGWIMQEAAQVIVRAGFHNYCCNAGGDMICGGTMVEANHAGTPDTFAPDEPRPWRVGIADPQTPDRILLSINISSLSVATSGTYRRRWIQDGHPRHHLIDPGTGLPSTSDIASCTVVHSSIVQAEVMAKVTLLKGYQEGIDWLKEQDTAGWVVVDQSGRVNHSWH